MTPSGSRRAGPSSQHRASGPGSQHSADQHGADQHGASQHTASRSLSAADLARARAAAASLGADFGADDDWEDAEAPGERDSLTDVPGGVRLQKVLAAAGVGSRRHCEELIGAGRVEVDGEVVRRFGARVDPRHQVIRVDGRRIPASEDLVYVALNKPAGVLTSMSDSRGRKTLTDLLGDTAERLFHVGRLDYDTEGLILLMNDGELAHRLAHPRFGVLKTYLADVPGPVPKDLGRRLISGIELEDGVASADKFRVVEQVGGRALVEITLHEGRKHIVRRMLAAAGHPVSRLVRTQVGPVVLGSLRPGTTRRLTTKEVGDLYAAVGL
ncbi:MAG TPA: pseudouridine synthase [Streptosporangiaceae bacterium]|jgi:pseudouridine synthase